MAEVNIFENQQQFSATSTGATGEFIKRQPLASLSGLGAAVGSVKYLMRQVRSMSPIKMVRPTQFKRLIPRYMKSNFVRYPAMMLLFLVTTRQLRLMLNH